MLFGEYCFFSLLIGFRVFLKRDIIEKYQSYVYFNLDNKNTSKYRIDPDTRYIKVLNSEYQRNLIPCSTYF